MHCVTAVAKEVSGHIYLFLPRLRKGSQSVEVCRRRDLYNVATHRLHCCFATDKAQPCAQEEKAPSSAFTPTVTKNHKNERLSMS